jgi:hypothetical protein
MKKTAEERAELRRAYHEQYRAKHAEERRQKARLAYAAKKARLGADVLAAQQKAWRKANPEKCRRYEANRTNTEARKEANRKTSAERSRKFRAKYPERMKEIRRKHYYGNHERRLASARKWYHDNREKALQATWCYMLKRCYGITESQYNEMGEACNICGAKDDLREKSRKEKHRLSVDHDKETGKIRGKLCGNCNTGIGLFKHDLGLMLKAMEYLDRTRDGFKFKPAA